MSVPGYLQGHCFLFLTQHDNLLDEAILRMQMVPCVSHHAACNALEHKDRESRVSMYNS